MSSDRTPKIELPSPLTDLLARLADSLGDAAAPVLAAFAGSILGGEGATFLAVDGLTEESDHELCVQVLSYCLALGLTEEERSAALDAFSPFIESFKFGTRH